MAASKETLRDRLIVRTSVVGIVTNLCLVAFKLLVGVLANSIAIILDAMNNLSDALSSVITILGTKLAGGPRTRSIPSATAGWSTSPASSSRGSSSLPAPASR